MDIWERRRKNLRAVLAYKGSTATAASKQSGLSINTVSKFIRGETFSVRQDTLDKLCAVAGLSNSAMLATDNPLSANKNRLFEIIANLSDADVEATLNFLSTRTE